MWPKAFDFSSSAARVSQKVGHPWSRYSRGIYNASRLLNFICQKLLVGFIIKKNHVVIVVQADYNKYR